RVLFRSSVSRAPGSLPSTVGVTSSRTGWVREWAWARSRAILLEQAVPVVLEGGHLAGRERQQVLLARPDPERAGDSPDDGARVVRRDRKSTRLNSSHLGISYAVFCLKKKSFHQ